MTYAELDFPAQKQKPKKRKKKKKQRDTQTDYASIDFSKVGTPLPESSSSEEDIFDYIPDLQADDDENN